MSETTTITHACGHTHEHGAWVQSPEDVAWYAAQQCGACTARVAPRRSRRSHPLGVAVEDGDGYTVYEDTAFGGGRIRIYDES